MKVEIKQHLLLGVATFSLGASTMAIEMTASRVIAPHFGASLFVWTSLIVTVLLSMSAGYWLGGKAAEKGSSQKQSGIVSVCAAFTLFIGTHGVPAIALSITPIIFKLTSGSVALFLGSLIYTLLAFSLPVMFLASAGPMLIKAWAKGGDIGSTAGNYFATSTAGSVLGTIAPTLVLVPQIGSSATLDAVTILLVLVGILLIGWPQGKYISLAVIPFTLFAPFGQPLQPGNTLDLRESPYQLIGVYGNHEGTRFMTFNEASAVQSMYNPNGGPFLPYIDVMTIASVIREPKAGLSPDVFHGLILGLAGGGIPRSYAHTLPPTTRIELTGVEIDPEVIAVARKWFDLDDLKLKIVNADARTFLANTQDKYDSIAIDAYSVQLYIPPHLATKEFFNLVSSHLNPEGVMSININASSLDSKLLKTMVNTVATAFSSVLVVPVTGTSNYAVFASNTPIKPQDIISRLQANPVARNALETAFLTQFDPSQETFSDDRAPIEFMTDSMGALSRH